MTLHKSDSDQCLVKEWVRKGITVENHTTLRSFIRPGENNDNHQQLPTHQGICNYLYAA
jgi:hypothetical protein